uniref:Serpentine receptor class gamma n=1 Tax=Bursaphelenchus xylophilus TaxID=6326 RepID=A0A1I7RUP0_BURXY
MLFVNAFSTLTQYVLPIVTVAESICAPFITYLALFHSKKMHRYRFLIMNNVFWSCLFNWTVWFAKPAFLFPAACLILYNPQVHWVVLAKAVASFMMFTFINVELAIVWTLCYRYFMSIEKIRLLDQLPHFDELEGEIGYICVPNLLLVSEWTFAAFLAVISFFVFGMVLISIMFYRVMIVFPRSNMMSSTLQMHTMLFKAIQLLVAFGFILFPTALLLLTISVRWTEGTSIAALCIMLVQAHGCVDFLTIIYFITPYRRKLLQILGRNYRRIKTRVSSTVAQPVSPADEPEPD